MIRGWAAALALAAVTGVGPVAAQSPTPGGTPPGARQGRAGGRPGLPPLSPNMNQQQLQAYMDAYALLQADRELRLTPDQYPDFVARLRRLQDVRRRHMAERRRLLGELSGLLQGAETGRDEAITARIGALDEITQQAAADARKAYQELDALLTPWQRGRFRTFEEQLERQKVELLAKIRAGAGG
jgi:hypothetical protein